MGDKILSVSEHKILTPSHTSCFIGNGGRFCFRTGRPKPTIRHSVDMPCVFISSIPTGLEDVSKYPNLFAELIMRGWSDDDLTKISRENMLRVMRKVESFARKSKIDGKKPEEEWIERSHVAEANCRS